MAKIASPLFILREECAADLYGALEKIAAIGFGGAEFVGLFGKPAAEIKKRMDDFGLTPLGCHVPFDSLSLETEKKLTELAALGCPFVTIGPPGEDGLPGAENYGASVAAFNRIGAETKKYGMRLLFHNHAGELKLTASGKTILEYLMDDTDPELVSLEPDLGWIKIGGADPAYYLKKYAGRCPVVHFKDYFPDGAANGEFVFRPTGYGVMNSAELYAECLAMSPRPEWYVTDHDCSYERDPYFDLRLSYDYFKNLTEVAG